MRTAFVIPADPREPCRTVEFTDERLVDVLYREIGCDTVDIVRLQVDGVDEVAVWVDDNGRSVVPQLANARFNTLARGLGQPMLIFGTVVLTGGADEDGATLGLPAELLASLPDAVQGVTA